MSNVLRIYDAVPVDGLVPTVWSEMSQEGFLHDKLIPDNPMLDPDKGKIFRILPNYDQNYGQPTESRDQAQEIKLSKDSIEYETKTFRRKYFIDPNIYKASKNPELAKLQERQIGAMVVTRANRVKMEADCASLFNNVSPTGFTQTVSAISWANLATSDPVADLNALAYQIGLDRGVKVNSVVLGARAWSRFCSNASVKKNIATVINNKVNKDIALDLIQTGDLTGIGSLYVGTESVEGANPAQPSSRTFLYNQDLVWIGFLDNKPMGRALNSAVAGKYKTFGDNEQYVDIYEYNQPGTARDSSFVEAESAFDYVILDNKLGRILST